MTKTLSPTYWKFDHRDKNGKIVWSQDWTPNALADEGEQAILDVFFRAATAPTTFYLGLYNDTPVETDGLSDLTGEPSTFGYAREEITRDNTGWPTLALDSGDYQLTSATVQFGATGGSWGPVTYAVLATTANDTGLLIAFVALSQSRTLNDGETLDVSMALKAQ